MIRMKTFFIEIPRDLTSYEFYNNILLQKEDLRIQMAQSIVLDFSKTYRIEPLVIPNLLGLGYEILQKHNKTAQIYIPEISYAGELKNYLNEIQFTKYVEKYGLYHFITSPYGGMQGKKIDPVCGTLYFDADNSVDEITRGVEYYIAPFADEYLFNFKSIKECQQGFYYTNEITEFLEEVITNCKKHAKSFSFTTLQAKYSVKKIYISVSDFGCGFSNTIDQQGETKDEISAIMEGVYKRRESKVYGLYNVIRRVLEYDGKVRIHSNNAQVIFTPRLLKSYINSNLYNDENFYKYNVKRDMLFNGVHIEMELPLERGKCSVYN